MLKKKRKRTVPSLKEREKTRPKPKPQDGFVLPSDPNAPKELVQEATGTRFLVYREALKNFPWKKLAVTFVLILIGGVGSAAFQARNANLQRDISNAERELRQYRSDNFAMESLLQERYTFYEIERIATDRLGMSFPDASQIIHINVPRVGGVTLNMDEDALPQHNYFWEDTRNFFSGLFNQIFGG